MPFLKYKNCNTVREVDNTAKALLNLGRTIGSVRPYMLHVNLGVTTIIVDTKLLERFLIFCAALDTYSMTDTEHHLFMSKFSTETKTKINEVERAMVFEQLSDEVLKLIEETSTTDEEITQTRRIDSEKNRTEDGLC